MKQIRLLVLIFLIASCNSSRQNIPDTNLSYKEFLRVDSLARTNPDSAFFYYNEGVVNSIDSSYKGTFLQRMALIQQDSGDYNGSNESAIKSLGLFNQNNKNHYPNISYNYNLLGTNCLDLGRFDDALAYYDHALQYADSSNMPIFLNNKGVVYQRKKEYKKAIQYYEKALRDFRSDTLTQAMIYSNFAISRWLQDPGYPALNQLHEARKIRELMNDKLGLNASYSYLADFYQQSNPDSAIHYAKKMYSVAKDLNRADDQAEALDKLIRLSFGSVMKNYYNQYDLLNDSIHLARTNASNQFADIRYATEKARADNLLLEKDNTQIKLKIIRQRIIIYSTVVLSVAFIFFGILWYRKRQRLQEIQTKNAIKDSELKTSKKVHDVVANGLYRIMNELEHSKSIEKESLLNKIEGLYEQSRDISYDHSYDNTLDHEKHVHQLLSSFANQHTKIIVVGNQSTFWNNISASQRHELQLVFEEIMVNMQKHSRAKNVIINFKLESGKGWIIYTDDGIGFQLGKQFGNGLNNTVSRIKSINGQITFGKNGEKGVLISIRFPLEPVNP